MNRSALALAAAFGATAIGVGATPANAEAQDVERSQIAMLTPADTAAANDAETDEFSARRMRDEVVGGRQIKTFDLTQAYGVARSASLNSRTSRVVAIVSVWAPGDHLKPVEEIMDELANAHQTNEHVMIIYASVDADFVELVSGGKRVGTYGVHIEESMQNFEHAAKSSFLEDVQPRIETERAVARAPSGNEPN